MTTPLDVGIVGTGEMGRPLVHRLLGAGHRVTAYARRTQVRQELQAAGARVVDHLHHIAQGQTMVIVYVYSDQQVREILLEDGLIDAAQAGCTFVVHTTASPTTMEAAAAAAENRGVCVVDAPGSGGPAQVADGSLTLFVGGAADRVDACRPLFEAYASRAVHFGPTGTGQRVKLLNNLLFGAQVQLAIDAARLAEGFELNGAEVARALNGCSGSSHALDLLAAMGSVETLLDAAGHFIHKDVLVARSTAAEIGVPLGSFDEVTQAALDATAAR